MKGNTKMKKKLLYVVVFLIFIILVGYNYKQYIPEIPSRFAKYHNTGKISVVSDGKEVDLNGVKLSYSIETGECVETLILDDGDFKFKKGNYGPNYFSFKIPNENIGEVQIEFGQFNTNWWRVCDYDLQIDMISQNDGTVHIEMKRTLTIDGYDDVHETCKIITLEDNKISSFTGP